MKIKLDRKLLAWLIPAVILRLFFASFFFHPDIKSQHFHAQFLSRGVVNIYDYIAANLDKLPYKDTFNYPPLTYFVLGGWDKIAGLIVGQSHLTAWLNDWGPGGYFSPLMFEFLLVLKFPYLLLDLATGFLLVKYLSDPKLKTPLLYIWFFNPVSLYAVYMLGQFDIICAFLTVLALLLIKQKNLWPAALCLGLGAALKSYPLLLFPFLLFRIKNIREFIYSFGAFLFGFAGPMLPVINSTAYRYTMTHSNLMQSIFISGLDVSATQKIPFYVIFYFFILLVSWGRRKNLDLLPEFFSAVFFVILVSDFHAQWIVWSLPFLALLWVRLKQACRPLFLAVVVGYFLTVFLVPDQYVLLGILSPLNSQTVIFPPLSEMVKQLIDPLLLQGFFRTILVGSGLWLLYLTWKSYAEN
jgi:Gpi18-like mannosyltransferase